MLRSLAPLVGALALGGVAQAQLVSIPPFSGALQEGFETQSTGAGGGHSGFQPCVVGDVFQGNATLCTPGASGTSVTGGWGFACSIQEHGGAYFYGSAGGYSEFVFQQPMQRFGGHFGANSPASGPVDVVFYDAVGNQVGADQMNHPSDCTWYWYGWESSTPFTRVTITNTNYGGAFVMMDDLEADATGGSGTSLGSVYCNSFANSTGQVAQIEVFGSAVASDNNIVLKASDMPVGFFGYFCSGRVPGLFVMPGGSQGNLCLNVPFGRWSSNILTSDANGSFQLPIDLNNMPNAFPPMVSAGETFHFQAWFRDMNPSNTHNLTNAVAVVFQ